MTRQHQKILLGQFQEAMVDLVRQYIQRGLSFSDLRAIVINLSASMTYASDQNPEGAITVFRHFYDLAMKTRRGFN